MKLTVKPLKQKDAGRGLAAVDRDSMDELALENGDYVVIDGQGDHGRAVARVWPGYPEDDGDGVVRIDGRLRKEADVGIDDQVTVEPADIKPAGGVTVPSRRTFACAATSRRWFVTGSTAARSPPGKPSPSRSGSAA